MSRKKPSNEEIIKAIKESMYSAVGDYERVRLGTQRRLKTVASTASAWIYEAITAPGQDELVLLRSSDSKFVGRVTYNEDSDSYSFYGDLRGGKTPLLYLDYAGNRTDSGRAVRNKTWVVRRSIVDGWVAELLKEEKEKQAQHDKQKAAEDALTEEIIGTELSMVRGMLVAADITPGDRTLTAWALRVDKGEGKTARRARVTIELNARQLVQFSKWLTTRNVQPITPELLAKMDES